MKRLRKVESLMKQNDFAMYSVLFKPSMLLSFDCRHHIERIILGWLGSNQQSLMNPIIQGIYKEIE